MHIGDNNTLVNDKLAINCTINDQKKVGWIDFSQILNSNQPIICIIKTLTFRGNHQF